jgi:hypothetical protein
MTVTRAGGQLLMAGVSVSVRDRVSTPAYRLDANIAVTLELVALWQLRVSTVYHGTIEFAFACIKSHRLSLSIAAIDLPISASLSLSSFYQKGLCSTTS